MTEVALTRPPASFRPDRLEVIQSVGKRAPIEFATGVQWDCLIGPHNGAKNLTTGQLTLVPHTRLALHRYPVSESITVLSGQVVVSVEGREYALGPLDNLVIPRALAHSVRNDAGALAQVHLAFPSARPTREWVTESFEPRALTEMATCPPGKERVTRFKTAPRSEAGPGTSFIDYFNQDLMPGLEMSGGYGAFRTGGRLPAHFHDFDESICIIDGTATCIVEGRRHQMSDGATALQPRGRVHYFINESPEPMAMIWVYAGPLPERIVTDECCATASGDPWKAAGLV